MSDSNVKQLTRNQEEMAPIHAFIAKNAGMLVKLMTFSAALLAFPILTFFCTLHTLFEGNTTYAAGAAALMANVIVILYIIVAIFEKPAKDDVTEEKKDN
ncbi:hypothetical protein BDF21DRAFT_217530 [Thamnidium elegans]|nr:hypothetical protein BDF21DRAFT_217530 [Thamnidium elegans]